MSDTRIDPDTIEDGPTTDIVPRPQRLNVTEEGRSLRVSWRWFTMASLGLLLFCVLWDSFLVTWYAAAFGRTDSGSETPWMMVVFPIGHVAVGIGMTYFTVASFVNTSAVEISDESVRVHHGPMPWPGNRVVPSSEIEQVYCTEGGGWASYSNRYRQVYRVQIALKDGSSRVLVKGLADLEMALYIEQAIEVKLDIEDRPVRGEVGRTSAPRSRRRR